ncbi:MAG: hypothetical protein ACKOQ3_05230 [Novosphingobium sp.]
MIRQFALVTIIVTGLIAMFADGENSEVIEALRAREAKTQLAKEEAARLGARKVGTMFKQEKREESGEGYEKLNDQDSMISRGGNWASSTGYAAPGYRPAFMRDDPQPFIGNPPPTAPKGVIVRRKKPVILTEREIAALKEAARLRAGTALDDAKD